MKRLSFWSVSACVLLVTSTLLTVQGAASAVGKSCDGEPATLVIDAAGVWDGTDGDDVVVITSPDVVQFDALAGDDTICAGPGNTNVFGGPGDDTVFGEDGNDLVYGDEGNDHVDGGPGNDEVFGDDPVSGPDLSTPNDDVDVVDGGSGDDLVFDTSSNESLTGGDGHDILTLNPYDEDDPELCQQPPPATPRPVLLVADHTVTGFGTDTFEGFESYQGGPFQDTLIGGPGNDLFEDNQCGRAVIYGRGGNDSISAFGCGATVNGGPGADTIVMNRVNGGGTFRGGRGADHLVLGGPDEVTCYELLTLRGGPGIDWLDVDAGSAKRISQINLDSGYYRGFENVHQLKVDVFLAHAMLVRRAIIAPVPMRIVGDNGPNMLIGGPGPTLIHGGHGHDVLVGGPGHDIVYGGLGHDACRAEVRHECEAH